jgi:hypothetical protein
LVHGLFWGWFLIRLSELGSERQLQLSTKAKLAALSVAFLGGMVLQNLFVLGRDLDDVAHVEFGQWLEGLADHPVLAFVVRGDLGCFSVHC